jgi:hypothetical protein
MKETTKKVRLIFVPTDHRVLEPGEWLLLNPKKNKLYVPAAGGQYRRMAMAGYLPVRPYLVCDDEITGKDISYGVAIFDKDRDAYYKVVATPNSIWGCQIILFNKEVKEDFDIRAMNILMVSNGGECKIQMEIDETDEEKTRVKYINGKVVIVI